MKHFLFLIFCLGLSVQLSAAGEVVSPISDEQTISTFVVSSDIVQTAVTTSITEDKLLQCFIINACGTNAQWCDEGLHPPLMGYISTLRARFCTTNQQ
jgi:hypothetical protein